jgi:hypothetical protein
VNVQWLLVHSRRVSEGNHATICDGGWCFIRDSNWVSLISILDGALLELSHSVLSINLSTHCGRKAQPFCYTFYLSLRCFEAQPATSCQLCTEIKKNHIGNVHGQPLTVGSQLWGRHFADCCYEVPPDIVSSVESRVYFSPDSDTFFGHGPRKRTPIAGPLHCFLHLLRCPLPWDHSIHNWMDPVPKMMALSQQWNFFLAGGMP